MGSGSIARVPRGSLAVFAISTDLAIAQGKHLCPVRLDHTSCRLYPASFMAEHHHTVIARDKFIRLKDFEL
jgi:hypothetical protein